MEKPVTIHNDTIRLQGMLDENTSKKAVLVTHPHPLYGGNMDNPVVLHIARAYAEKGFATLRFNFRGTGGSSGMFDNGAGEKTDVRAALGHLRDLGMDELHLAGYSFGARVNAGVMDEGCRVSDHIMVSPPAAFMSFDDISSMPATGLILTGERDDIAPPDTVRALIRRWHITPRFEILNGCDHFYGNCLGRLYDVLSNYLS